MFSVHCTSKWIHRAWILGWVVQCHPSFVKCLIGLEVFMWPLSCGAYVGDAGWSLVCFKQFFIVFASPLFFLSLISISDLFNTRHQTKDEHSVWQIQGEGFRALPGLNIFFLLFFIFHASLLSKPNMANICILSYFFNFYFTMKMVSYLPLYLRASNEFRRDAVMHVWFQEHFISATVQSQPGLQLTIWKKVLE